MTRQQNHFVKAATITAILVLGGMSSIASAGHDRGYERRGRYHHVYESEYAGKITIDGYSTWIRSDRAMLRQIAGAFRRAGYRVRVIDGRVRVDYGYCRPTVQWSTRGYKARMHWDYEYDELSISLVRHYPRQQRRRDRVHRIRVSGWGSSCRYGD